MSDGEADVEVVPVIEPRLQHLVTVWNPMYGADPVVAHLDLLGAWAEYCLAKGNWDEMYVWWGRIRSENRVGELSDALRQALDAIDAQIAQHDTHDETHLYITDYRSLYVANVIEVCRTIDTNHEQEHVPAYYFEPKLRACDCWFKLSDIRLLVRDDLDAVVRELAKLANVRYHHRPVSIYGGMVDLPLVVERPDGTQFFHAQERDQLLGDQIWAQAALERGAALGERSRELREHLFGPKAWYGLVPEARLFIATGEMIYRELAAAHAPDVSPALVCYAKAVEVQYRRLLQRVLQKATSSARCVEVSSKVHVDLTDAKTPLTLGTLARALVEPEGALKAALGNGIAELPDEKKWFTQTLPKELASLAEVRNPGAHDESVDLKTVSEWRDKLLGIGVDGTLVRLGRMGRHLLQR